DPNDLKGPVHNKANFSKISSAKFSRGNEKKSKYIHVEENSTSIPIKSEFRSILIDYMQSHWIRRSLYTPETSKRENMGATGSTTKKQHKGL
ncbi:hypothetical protein TYRP_002392, partial [Tyrophagus putrescentiae]